MAAPSLARSLSITRSVDEADPDPRHRAHDAIDALRVPSTKPLQYFDSFEGDDYLVYDEHDKAPHCFCVRVDKKASVFFEVAGRAVLDDFSLAGW